ncbi:MAG: hypothetical protein ACLUH5_05170 [Eubacterium sp.]
MESSNIPWETIIFSLVSVIHIRLIMSILVDFYYNRSAIKKIKKTEKFKDKLTFAKYKKRIPQLFYICYFVIITVNALGLILLAVFYAIPKLKACAYWDDIILTVFNILCIATPHLLFWQKDMRAKGFKFDRWLKK